MPEFQIKIKGLDTFIDQLVKYPKISAPLFDRALKKSIAELQGSARRLVPVKTGNLRSNILADFAPLRGRLYAKPAYAVFVHEGTKSHEIRPSRRRALFWKGADNPVKRVLHPGTMGIPFMTGALEDKREQINSNFAESIEKTLQQIAAI